jgi:TonB family protein
MATQVSDTGGKTRGASDELALIAQRAQAFTNASGTAIALSEGSVDEIVCRARSGSSAPDVGTALRVEGSFTGLCIQSGKELRCDDAETDTRVDTTAIRALGIRSMVVTPIKEENRVVGVLAVFAPNAHAFTITHVAVLKTMADQISVHLQKERRAKEEGVQPEPARHEPARPSMPIATARPVPAAPTLPAPVVIKPAEPAPTSRAAFPVVSRVEPIKTTVVADDIASPPPSKREQRSEPRINLASFEAAGEEKKSGVSLILMGVVAVVVIAVASTFFYLRMHKHSSPAVAQNVQPSPNPAATQPPVPAAGTASNTQPPATTASNSVPAVKPPAETVSERRTDRTPAPKPSVAERSTPETRAPETVALSKAPSKIATSTPDSSSDSAPALVVGAGSPGAGTLSALAKTSSSSAQPSMLTQSELQPVEVVRRVAPIFPTIARQRRLSGILVVDALVDKTGKVTTMQLISGPPIFKDAAFEAVKQWQFKPAKLNGQPIDQNTQIKLQFTP